MDHYNKIMKVAAYVLDYERTNAYNRFFREHAKDKVICEIGTGTGVLAHLASVHGAKKVYSYEISKSIFNFARDVLEDRDNILLINKNAMKAKFPQDIDFFVHELLGNFVFDEGIDLVIKNIKQQFPNAKLYPSQIDIFKFINANKVYSFKFDKLKYDKEVLSFIEKLQTFNIDIKECINYLVTQRPVEREKITSFDLMAVNTDIIKKSLPIYFCWQTTLSNITFGNYPRELSTWGAKRQQYP